MNNRLYYGWVLAFVAFTTILVAYGVRYSFSVFYVELLKEFGWSRAATASIQSLNILVYGFTGPFAGFLLNRYGRKVLPIGAIALGLGTIGSGLAHELWQFYGLAVVIAAGMVCSGFVPQSAILSRWFVRYRGTAQGIGSAGYGGAFVIGLVAALIIPLTGWRAAYALIGGLVILINVPLLAIFVRTRPQDMGLNPDGDPQPIVPLQQDDRIVDKQWASVDWSLWKAMKTYRLWLLVLASGCFWGLAFNLATAHQVAFSMDVGYSEIYAASVFGFFGVIHLTGNLCGFLSDRLGREWTYSLGCALTVSAFLVLMSIHDTSQPWMLYLYSVLFGLGSGIVSATGGALYADIFQGPRFAAILGFIMAGMGLLGAIGPWLGGYVHDVSGSYYLAFLAPILGTSLACTFIWIAGPRKVRRTGRVATIRSA